MFLPKVTAGKLGMLDVELGQSVTSGQKVGLVNNVFSEVRKGEFRTWLLFSCERPENIRSGQTYYINLQLGQPTMFFKERRFNCQIRGSLSHANGDTLLDNNNFLLPLLSVPQNDHGVKISFDAKSGRHTQV